MPDVDLTADDVPDSEVDDALAACGFDSSEPYPEYGHTSLREAWRDGYDNGAAAAQRLTSPPQPGTDLDDLCRVMHDAYEEAATREGWTTQERSRKPWEDVPQENKRTMRAAVTALLGALAKADRDR